MRSRHHLGFGRRHLILLRRSIRHVAHPAVRLSSAAAAASFLPPAKSSPPPPSLVCTNYDLMRQELDPLRHCSSHQDGTTPTLARLPEVRMDRYLKQLNKQAFKCTRASISSYSEDSGKVCLTG